MKIHLLRHTKPEIRHGICYGQTDIGLSQSFSDEQLTIKKRLGNIAFDAVFSSPLKRCVQLAESLCPDNKKINIDVRLKEINFGTWEMMQWQDISKSNEAKKWFNDYVHVKCPEGESFIDLHNRVREFLTMLKKQNQFKQALIITHAGIIRAIFSIINDIDPIEAFDLNIAYGELKTFQL
ncbi:MAG: alpha-ribazole phosphatase [Bacteroidota bacterium]|nr:alpha-ribazole phosphatase [Bacteroidota bacterium]